jgi:hypothetical protein
MNARDLSDDDALLAVLSDALAEHDPVPEPARAAAMAAFDLGHLEGELAEVLADSAADGPLVGARHEAAFDRFVEFAAGGLRIELDLPAHEPVLVGQLDPPGPSTVRVEFASSGGGVERVSLTVDELGRFQGDLRPGSLRLHVMGPSGPVATPWVVR